MKACCKNIFTFVGLFFSYMDIISIVWCNKTLKIEKLLSYSDLSLKQHLLFYIIAIRPLVSHFIRLSIVVNLFLTCFYLFSCHSFIHGSFLSPHQLSLSMFFNNDDLTLFSFLILTHNNGPSAAAYFFFIKQKQIHKSS